MSQKLFKNSDPFSYLDPLGAAWHRGENIIRVHRAQHQRRSIPLLIAEAAPNPAARRALQTRHTDHR